MFNFVHFSSLFVRPRNFHRENVYFNYCSKRRNFSNYYCSEIVVSSCGKEGRVLFFFFFFFTSPAWTSRKSFCSVALLGLSSRFHRAPTVTELFFFLFFPSIVYTRRVIPFWYGETRESRIKRVSRRVKFCLFAERNIYSDLISRVRAWIFIRLHEIKLRRVESLQLLEIVIDRAFIISSIREFVKPFIVLYR